MPVIATEKKLSDVKADLNRLVANCTNWISIAEMVNQQTPSTKKADKNFSTAHGVHFLNNMWIYTAEGEKPQLEEKAFANMLVAIEIAPADVQRDAVMKVIPLLNDILDHPEGQDIEFYKMMFDKLGSRLHVSNQALVLEWVFKNCVTYIDDSQVVQFSDDQINHNDYVRGYADEAKLALAEKIFTDCATETGYPLSTPVTSWVSTLLPLTHERYIGEVIIPVQGGTCPIQLWIAPTMSGEESILVVDEEDPLLAQSLPDLLGDFKYSMRGHPLESQKPQIVLKTARDLKTLFTSKADQLEEAPSLQMAVLQTMSHLKTFNLVD